MAKRTSKRTSELLDAREVPKMIASSPFYFFKTLGAGCSSTKLQKEHNEGHAPKVLADLKNRARVLPGFFYSISPMLSGFKMSHELRPGICYFAHLRRIHEKVDGVFVRLAFAH